MIDWTTFEDAGKVAEEDRFGAVPRSLLAPRYEKVNFALYVM